MVVQSVGRVVQGSLERRGLLLAARMRAPRSIAASFALAAGAPRMGASHRAFSLWNSGGSDDATRAAAMEQLRSARTQASVELDPLVSDAKHAASSVQQGAEQVKETASNVGHNVHEAASRAGTAVEDATSQVAGSVQDRLAQANAASAPLSHDVETIATASDQATTELTSLGLGGWSPSGILQHLLDTTQYLTQLPWWATIILVTCGIRLSIAPLLVYVQGNSIRLSNIQPQMQSMLADLEYAKSTGNQQEMQRSAVQVRKLLADNNCSPFRSLLLPVVQMPIFLSFYFALDGLAKAKLPALTTGGFGWVPDLTLADPYYILPITSSVMTLLVLETGAETGTTGMNQTAQARMVKNVLRGVTVLAAWFVSSFPAALLLYWTTTNTFSLLQLLALRTRFLKRLLRLPERVEHPTKPAVKEKSFMEGLRSGLNSGAAHPSSDASARRPPPSSLYARKATDARADIVNTARTRALNSMLSDDTATSKTPTPSPSRAAATSDKQARVAAARERRLRQRQ